MSVNKEGVRSDAIPAAYSALISAIASLLVAIVSLIRLYLEYREDKTATLSAVA